jgi:hypothetical protein
MNITQQRIVWLLALVLSLATGWLAATRPDPYRAGAPLGAIDDRREYHFRHLSYSSTQRLFENLLGAAQRAPDPVSRARMLARVAALQRERGIDDGARAAASEAMRLGGNDAEVQRLLGTPLELPPALRAEAGPAAPGL